MTAAGARTYSWTSYNLPYRIQEVDSTTDFLYGPERQRIRQAASSSARGARLTYFFSGLYEEEVYSTYSNRKHHINTPQGVVAIETRGPSPKIEYLHRDHLGSLVAITDAGGGVTQRLSFDAFGSRRGEAWEDKTTQIFVTNWGYTSHQQQDDFGLIHMNGRVYDPSLARFISADPFVQAPGNTQSFNRYSYVFNNPLAHTDPSGFFSLKQALNVLSTPFAINNFIDHQTRHSAKCRAVFTTIATVYGGPLLGGLYSTYATKRIGGTWGEALKAGTITTVSATLAAGINTAFADASAWVAYPTTTVLHGAVGGAASVASGGKFKNGFSAGAASAALSPAIGRLPVELRPLAGAVIGGTASELGGGKFANGAVTGAFVYTLGVMEGDNQQNRAELRAVVADVAGKIWAAPNTVLGLVVGGVAYGVAWAGHGIGLNGAPSISIGNNAIQFENIPFGDGALTLGNTITYGGGTKPTDDRNDLYGDPRMLNLGLHEQGHTRQYQEFGPFFLPAYLVGGGITRTNPFETGANNYAAGGGWW